MIVRAEITLEWCLSFVEKYLSCREHHGVMFIICWKVLIMQGTPWSDVYHLLKSTYHAGNTLEWCLSFVEKYLWRVPGQNDVSQAWYIVEIHHSGRKPSLSCREHPEVMFIICWRVLSCRETPWSDVYHLLKSTYHAGNTLEWCLSFVEKYLSCREHPGVMFIICWKVLIMQGTPWSVISSCVEEHLSGLGAPWRDVSSYVVEQFLCWDYSGTIFHPVSWNSYHSGNTSEQYFILC